MGMFRVQFNCLTIMCDCMETNQNSRIVVKNISYCIKLSLTGSHKGFCIFLVYGWKWLKMQFYLTHIFILLISVQSVKKTKNFRMFSLLKHTDVSTAGYISGIFFHTNRLHMTTSFSCWVNIMSEAYSLLSVLILMARSVHLCKIYKN